MNKFIEYRREFHKFPETGWREIRTSARIAEILEKMGYQHILMGPEVVEISSVAPFIRMTAKETEDVMKRAKSQGASTEYVERTKEFPGVIAILDTGIPGPTTAFRFDIDCLPYEEFDADGYPPKELGFLSQNSNCVHACGHDGHTAIGLGAAEVLLTNKEKLCGRIKFIFQPAEETFYGAQSIVDKGHLDDVDYFIALHIALTAEGIPLPSHSIACGCKDFLSDRQLDVTFLGKAAHPCGASQEGKNALLAACSAALNLHCIAPHEEGLCRINVGTLHAGIAINTIPPQAELSVEFRGESTTIAKYAENRVFDVLNGTAKAYDMAYEYLDYGEVPAGKSDDALMEIIEESAKNIPWFEKIYYEGNVGGTDDATIMMSRVQENGGIAVYTGIGADTTQPLHNPQFDFDEDAIAASIELCKAVILEIHHRQ